MSKIRQVTDATGAVHLVRSATERGARKFVQNKLGQQLHVKVATQEDLVAALQAGIRIEDAHNDRQASIPEPAQTAAQAAGDTPPGEEE